MGKETYIRENPQMQKLVLWNQKNKKREVTHNHKRIKQGHHYKSWFEKLKKKLWKTLHQEIRNVRFNWIPKTIEQ